MDFFVLVLFSVFVYLIPENNKDYLAVQSTSGMKGIMAIMIIFHHISQHVTTGITFSNFNYMCDSPYLYPCSKKQFKRFSKLVFHTHL